MTKIKGLRARVISVDEHLVMEQAIVHNHGPSEGPGLDCNEITLGEIRIVACLLRAKAIFHQKE